MFTLITDRDLRLKLDLEDYIKRLSILASFTRASSGLKIIVRDSSDLRSQIETLEELNRTFKNLSNERINLTLNTSASPDDFIDKYNISSIHIKYKDYMDLSRDKIRSLQKRGIEIGTSIHSKAEFDNIICRKPDYVLLSPIFKSKCKALVEPIALNELKAIVKKASLEGIALIGLGGIAYESINRSEADERYKLFSRFAIRSIFYESEDLKGDLSNLESRVYG